MPRLSIKCVQCFLTPLLHVSALFTYTCLYLTKLSTISFSEIYIHLLICLHFPGSQNLGYSALIYESKEKNLCFILIIQIISQRQNQDPSQPSLQLFKECDLKDLYSCSELVLSGTGLDVKSTPVLLNQSGFRNQKKRMKQNKGFIFSLILLQYFEISIYLFQGSVEIFFPLIFSSELNKSEISVHL